MPNPDIEVLAMEISQGMQSLDNDVPLIAKRNTIVRLYARNKNGYTLGQGTKARLIVFRVIPPNIEIPLGVLLAENTPTITTTGGNRLDHDHSFWFELPSNWATGITRLVGDVNYDHFFTETSYANNATTRVVGYNTANPMRLILVPLVIYEGGDKNNPQHIYFCGGADCAHILQGALRYHPTDKIVTYPFAFPVAPFDPNKAWNVGSNADRTDINLHLKIWRSIFILLNPFNPIFSAYTWWGMVDPDATGSRYGWANHGVAHGVMADESSLVAPWYNTGGYLIGHEIGHKQGLNHVSCAGDTDGDGVLEENEAGSIDPTYPWPFPNCSLANVNPNGHFGLDISFKAFGQAEPGIISNDPAVAEINQGFPMMGYKRRYWVSPWELCKLMPTYGVNCTWPLAALQSTATPHEDAAQTAAPQAVEYYMVTGVVNATQDTAALYPGFKVQAIPPTQSPDDAHHSHDEADGKPWEGWTLGLEDSAGTALYSQDVEFEMPPHIDDEQDPEVAAALAEFVPFHPDTKWIRIRHDGVVKAQMEVSASSPQVQLLSPHSGDLAAGQIIRWQGSDPDGDTLNYTLLYSPDDGVSWQPMIVNSSLSEVTLSVAMVQNLPKSSTARLKILASDGVNTAEDISDGQFTAPGSAPSVLILTPEDETVAAVAEFVSFSVAAGDIEDGEIADEHLQWTSNRDGELGQGSALDTNALSPGRHTITVTATDSDGRSSQSSVDVIIQLPTLYLPLQRR